MTGAGLPQGRGVPFALPDLGEDATPRRSREGGDDVLQK